MCNLVAFIFCTIYHGQGKLLNELTAKMSETTELPNTEIERLWFELQQEMVAGSEIVSFETY